jgi:site-specific DNA-cytosine methylase
MDGYNKIINMEENVKKRKIGNVLSLFDGIGCGQLALKRAGIEFDNYYASEIDEKAIKVTNRNFPKTIQLGDVANIKATDLPEIDLIIGGSPCQGLSQAGLVEGLEDERSALFYHFVRLLEECKPKYWFLENVVGHNKDSLRMSEALGAYPTLVDSKTVSPQIRKRLYWSNFDFEPPSPKKISINSILEDKEVDGVNYDILYPAAIRRRKVDGKNQQVMEVRGIDINKSNCITSAYKDSVMTYLKPGSYLNGLRQPRRKFTKKECCRLQTLPDNYFDPSTSTNQVLKMCANSWTVDVIAHIFSFL